MADLRIDTLTSSLEKLETSKDTAETENSEGSNKQLSAVKPPLHDGYGFRPPSGISTPLGTAEIIVDASGLGWPGAYFSLPHFISSLIIYNPAKSTLSRMNASAEEKAAREQKITTAMKIILECIGEDPEREGLLRTPERYAKALMWMTKGYEERLAGPSPSKFNAAFLTI